MAGRHAGRLLPLCQHLRPHLADRAAVLRHGHHLLGDRHAKQRRNAGLSGVRGRPPTPAEPSRIRARQQPDGERHVVPPPSLSSRRPLPSWRLSPRFRHPVSRQRRTVAGHRPVGADHDKVGVGGGPERRQRSLLEDAARCRSSCASAAPCATGAVPPPRQETVSGDHHQLQ